MLSLPKSSNHQYDYYSCATRPVTDDPWTMSTLFPIPIPGSLLTRGLGTTVSFWIPSNPNAWIPCPTSSQQCSRTPRERRAMIPINPQPPSIFPSQPPNYCARNNAITASDMHKSPFQRIHPRPTQPHLSSHDSAISKSAEALMVFSSSRLAFSSLKISVMGHALPTRPSLNGRTRLRSAREVAQVCEKARLISSCSLSSDFRGRLNQRQMQWSEVK